MQNKIKDILYIVTFLLQIKPAGIVTLTTENF